MKHLYLYTTSGCHLCEKAEDLLQALASEGIVQWEPVEISDSDQLIEAYGIRIPVIRSEQLDKEIGWPFTGQELQDWVAGL